MQTTNSRAAASSVSSGLACAPACARFAVPVCQNAPQSSVQLRQYSAAPSVAVCSLTRRAEDTVLGSVDDMPNGYPGTVKERTEGYVES